MVLLTKVGKVAAPLAGAVFLEPLLTFFAPSVKPLVTQFIQSDKAKNLLKDLAHGAAQTGSGVCVEFLGNRAEALLGALEDQTKLDEALIVALRKAFADMRDDLRARNEHKILDSFDQFFLDWDVKLKQIEDSHDRKELLETKQFARLFYESRDAELEEQTWWTSIKIELESWTNYKSIPAELENYLIENLLPFANDALTSTLSAEKYQQAWTEFQKSVGIQVISILTELNSYIVELRELAKVASGQFIHANQSIEFSLRKPVDSLVKDLCAREIYIQRDAIVIGEETAKVNGLSDLATRDGYFLLAAPAGSGKSTLMAHWLRETGSSASSIKVCYHFYSKQEGTGDHAKGLTILSDQLLKAHHIQANVNSFSPATIDAIIPTSLELDHPARLIVIVDGLDEAGEPSTATDFLSLFKRVFPRKLGKNTTVLLTVRDDQGSNSLDYYRKELNLPLAALQIPEVSAGALSGYLTTTPDNRLRQKAQDADFVKAIISKTEGLAIYVHYLLDELGQTDEAQWSQIIATLPKGFEKYVSTSLPAALDGKPSWEDALSFIALTQSPLHKKDLTSLTTFSGHKLREADYDRISWNIKRWLRSEGDIWAFSHQKIGEVFYELYVKEERDIYLGHLLTYCDAWQEHESRYVLQNYAALLLREQREHELFQLASNHDFLNLQRDKLIDNPVAPLMTLQAAISCASAADKASEMARFALAHAEMAKEISRESWLDAYNRRGFNGALELADNLSDPQRKVIWYLLTAGKLVSSSREPEAEKVLRKLDSSIFPKLSPPLAGIAASLLRILLKHTKLNLVTRIYVKALEPGYLDTQIPEASKHFVEIGDYNKAEHFLRSIKDSGLRAEALGKLSTALFDAQHFDKAKELFDEAVETVRSIEEPGSRCIALCSLSADLAIKGDVEQAKQLITEAEQLASSVESPARVLSYLVVAYVQAQDFDSFLQRLHANQYREVNLKTLFRALLNTQHFSEAEQLARLIKEPVVHCQAIRNLATALFHAHYFDKSYELFDEAEAFALSMKEAGPRALSLSALATDLTLINQISRAKTLINEAEHDVHLIQVPELIFKTKRTMATALFYAQEVARAKDLFDEAEEIASYIENSNARSLALGTLVSALINARLLDKAELVALSIEDPAARSGSLRNVMSSRVDENSDPFESAALATDFVGTSMIGSQTFMTLASALAEVEHSDKSKELFEAAIQSARIEDPKSRGRTLSNIARALTHAQFFDKAEQVVNSIKDPELRAQITKEVAAGLTKAQLYDEAERVARSIKHPEPRAGALYTLATAFADAYRFGDAKQLFDEAKQITYSIKDFEDRSKALRDISRIVDPQQILAEVEHLKIVGDAALRVRCLCNLAVALAKVQFREESKQVFQKAEQTTSLTGPKLRPYSRSRIARQLIYTQFFDEAEEISRTIDLPKLRCQILSDIAVRLTQAQLSDRAKYLFEEAKETALLIQDFKVRSETIRHIAIGLIKANFLDDAVVVARELSTSDLVLVLDQYAQLRRSEALKTYILSLCYELDYALQGCAQMILLYEEQTESIISEISKSSLM